MKAHPFLRLTILAGVGWCVSTTSLHAQSVTAREVETLTSRISSLEQEITDLRAKSAEREAQLQEALALLKEQTAMLQSRMDGRSPSETLEGPPGKAVPLPSTVEEFEGPESVLSKLGLTLYGFVKIDAIYNSQEVDNARIPGYVKSPDSVEQGEFDITARQTRFGVKIDGPDYDFVETSGVVETDFYGDVGGASNSLKPRLRKAFAQLDFDTGTQILFGRDYDTYISVVPKTVNFGTLGNFGWVWDRRDTIRLCQEFDLADNFRIVAKAAVADSAADDDTESPNLQWNIGVHPVLFGDREATFSFSGMWDLDGTSGGNYETFLLMANAKIPFGDFFTLQGSVWQGRNLGAPFHAGIKQGVINGREVEGWGGFVQGILQPVEPLSVALTYGCDDPDNEDLIYGSRSLNETAAVGFFYKFFDPLTGMLEYQYMETEYIEMATGENHRVQGAMLFSF